MENFATSKSAEFPHVVSEEFPHVSDQAQDRRRGRLVQSIEVLEHHRQRGKLLSRHVVSVQLIERGAAAVYPCGAVWDHGVPLYIGGVANRNCTCVARKQKSPGEPGLTCTNNGARYKD